jgi:hypothetical protein
MIFYLVPAAQGRPAKLEPTQADANREARERGLKVRAPDMEHNVPTVKSELMDYINDLMAGAGGPVGYAGSIPAPGHPDLDGMGVDITEIAARDGAAAGDKHLAPHTPWGRGETAPDGHPECRAGVTSAQVHASVLPKSEKVQDVCYVISKMTAPELGFVALEVISRGARLGGLA